MKCRHGVCRMSEHCGEGKCGWFEPAETRISSVQSTALLDALRQILHMARAPQSNDWFKVEAIAEHAIASNNPLCVKTDKETAR